MNVVMKKLKTGPKAIAPNGMIITQPRLAGSFVRVDIVVDETWCYENAILMPDGEVQHMCLTETVLIGRADVKRLVAFAEAAA